MMPFSKSVLIRHPGARRYAGIPVVLPLIVLMSLLSACSFSLAEDVTPPPGYRSPPVQPQAPVPASAPNLPQRAPDPASGAAIYAESCAPCHGADGLGDGPQAGSLPNPASPIGDPALAWQAFPLEWFAIITDGRLDRFMPPFANSLSDQQRWDVLAYVYSLSAPGERVAEGEARYQEHCAGCHGAAGTGDGPDTAGLSTELPDFSDPAGLADRSVAGLFQVITEGIPPTMPAYAAQLSDDDRWSLALYVRSLSTAAREQAIAAGAEAGEVPDASLPDSTEAETPSADTASVEPDLRDGTVTGLVINGSGGEIPVGLTAILHAFDHIQEVYSTTTTVEPNGDFLFQDVEMTDERIFMVTVEYSQATYNSDLGIVQDGEEILNLPITIYETTTDSTMLVVDRLHIFVENMAPGLLQVTELYLISNPGDRVVVAAQEGEPVVEYSLPAAATNLRFQSDAPESRFVPTANGFGDTIGVPPGTGQYQVMFAYDVPYDRRLDLETSHTLPINAVIMLLPEIGIRVKSDQLQDGGVREIQGETFRVYTGNRLQAGQRFSMSLTGNIQGSGAGLVSFDSQASLILGLAVFGLALVSTGIWLFRRNREALMEAEGSKLEELANGTEESIIDAIIALDDLYRAGDLPEGAYRNRRAELKDRLKDLNS